MTAEMHRKLYGYARASGRRAAVRVMAHMCRPLRVVVGSATTRYPGWISTDQDILDITSEKDWSTLFRPGTIDRILCEHVLEHLSDSDSRVAIGLCARYLQPGGVLRLAVPDGYRRDKAYRIESAPPTHGHQQFFTIDTLVPLLATAGLTVSPLEYFDAEGAFHSTGWLSAQGMIRRSVRFDRQEAFHQGDLYYTSLIVDACRPLAPGGRHE